MEVEAVLGVFVEACRPLKKGKGKKGSKKVKSLGADGERGLNGMGSAGDVRRWGVGRGWVR